MKKPPECAYHYLAVPDALLKYPDVSLDKYSNGFIQFSNIFRFENYYSIDGASCEKGLFENRRFPYWFSTIYTLPSACSKDLSSH